MSRYEPFAELYESRPVLAIREQLKYCASVAELATAARAKGFDVQYVHGGFVNDAVIRKSQDESARAENHTIRSAKRFIENYTGSY